MRHKRLILHCKINQVSYQRSEFFGFKCGSWSTYRELQYNTYHHQIDDTWENRICTSTLVQSQTKYLGKACCYYHPSIPLATGCESPALQGGQGSYIAVIRIISSMKVLSKQKCISESRVLSDKTKRAEAAAQMCIVQPAENRKHAASFPC